MDGTRFAALTFDCYGTLIDWETGILEALRPAFAARGLDTGDGDALLECFARREARAEHGAWRPYRSVLAEVFEGIAEESGFAPAPDEPEAFADSVGVWPAFPDSADALRALGARYRLAVVSNVDDDLFERSSALLGIEFDEVVTAQQVRSYKPAPGHFHEALERLDLPVERVLHVAQSLYHDVKPAKALGFTCAWVNRRVGRASGGATAPAQATPDLEVPSMAALVEALL